MGRWSGAAIAAALVLGACTCSGEQKRISVPESIDSGTTDSAAPPDASGTVRRDAGPPADPCEVAAERGSYIGCEYWPTTVLNSLLSGKRQFGFAVAIANPQTVNAEVEIDRGGDGVLSLTVAPGQLETVELPWVEELRGTLNEERSSVVRGGAYRLRSSVPVTVYQFNALEYVDPPSCLDAQCFSETNDASLLLPTHVLTGNYIVMSRASQLSLVELGSSSFTNDSPGYFAVVGADDGPVTVEVRLTGRIAGSADGTIGELGPGDTASFVLESGDVLQVVAALPEDCPEESPRSSNPSGTTSRTFCLVGDDYDLTGTEIRATGPVQVISGHNCAFVPFDAFACDHLEEALFPLESWGKDYLVSASRSLRGEPNLVRVISGHDDNTITFTPDVHAPVTLDRGQYIEAAVWEDVRVQGDEAILVGQLLVGQEYEAFGEVERFEPGDPSLSLAIPIEQYRTDYTFLSPDTYDVSYVNVTAEVGQTVRLDGMDIAGFRDVPGTGLATARVEIEPMVHHIESDRPFGIVVYGFGAYTSYMYPGGLDLEAINIPF